MQIFLGLLIPFLGTMLGSGTVFLMRNKMNKKISKIVKKYIKTVGNIVQNVEE